ncbi:hypothetical protein ElyMa_004803300 [Elysia marginata]|uniref:Uncharacterized protein n=1 Tax=Elysia marginata TaxID=1093978 RepID=A0AAV4IIN4_9GAST|nr:hypothetical protein ElyMa_004803300 [Elysia marginata]
MVLNFHWGDRYESTWVVVVYLIIVPIGGFVFMHVWTLILEVCCDLDDSKAQELGPATNRTMAIAPILTKLPPNFKFANYVDEIGSESSNVSSSALSLNGDINIPSLLVSCMPCTRCTQTVIPMNPGDQILTIPPRERRTLTETTKMASVANWLGMDSHDPSVVRGAALIIDTHESVQRPTLTPTVIADIESQLKTPQ